MTMTLLQVVQEFCGRTGLDIPTAVASSTDSSVLQFKGLLNEIVGDITSRGESWPLLQKQALHTTVAAEAQGLMTAIAPYGFKYIILDTIFDRTQRRPLFGPRGAQLWQASEAMPYTGPYGSYRVWQGQLYIQPAPEAGHEVAFEYASNCAIQGATSSTDSTLIYKRRFTLDSDVFLLDEELLLLGLRWNWKAEKGLRFVTEKQAYEAYLADAMGNDNTKGAVSMSNDCVGDIKPGIFVPLGNWPV